MGDRYDRVVTGTLVVTMATCTVLALAVRPQPLPAAAGARWEKLEAWQGGPAHIFGRSWAVDTFTVGPNRQPFIEQVIPFAAGLSFGAAGWAVDPRTRRPATGVVYRIDRERWLPARYGTARPDVAARFGADAERSGFEATAATRGLTPGMHELDLATVSGHGAPLPMIIRPPLRFVITP